MMNLKFPLRSVVAQSVYRSMSLLTFAFLCLMSSVSGQANHLEFRFINGEYHSELNTYTIDVEVKSAIENAALYAMNLRFFYEAGDLKLQSFQNFKNGYGLTGKQRKAMKGSEKSADNMFNLSGPAGYVNQGIEMKDVNMSDWKLNQWERVATVSFSVLTEDFAYSPCPSFVWDKHQDARKGGLLKGSMGAASTFIGLSGQLLECKSASCSFDDFQWVMQSDIAPYGVADKGGCLSAFQLSNELEISSISLSQNAPNPFDDLTTIEFSLPHKDIVTFSVYDLKGVLLYQVKNTYDVGINQINLSKEQRLPTGTLMYQIETKEYTSDLKRMVKIQ